MSKESSVVDRLELIDTLRRIKALADECIQGITGSTARKLGRHASKRQHSKTQHLNFDLNERAFVKANVAGMGGSKKFVLILAYLAKGETNAEVSLRDIEKKWSRMTSLLGTFNRKYSNDAKESGWVNSKKKGSYVLTGAWKDILIR